MGEPFSDSCTYHPDCIRMVLVIDCQLIDEPGYVHFIFLQQFISPWPAVQFFISQTFPYAL